MTDLNDDIMALRDALAAGPTYGPWEVSGYALGMPVATVAHIGDIVVGPANGGDYTDHAACETDANYIAAVNPDRMARIVAALTTQQDADRRARELASQGKTSGELPKTFEALAEGCGFSAQQRLLDGDDYLDPSAHIAYCWWQRGMVALVNMVRPTAWVFEFGAWTLPAGDPSRITYMTAHPTRAEAEAQAAKCKFDWHIFPAFAVGVGCEVGTAVLGDLAGQFGQSSKA